MTASRWAVGISAGRVGFSLPPAGETHSAKTETHRLTEGDELGESKIGYVKKTRDNVKKKRAENSADHKEV